MKIAVGTQNNGKIEAVKNGLMKYPDYLDIEVIGVKTDSGVNHQPIGLDETILGAKNRARLAYELGNSDLGFGLEAGIFLVPQTKSDYMDTTACAIYDGKEYHLGLSKSFREDNGMIGLLTKGIITRTMYSEQAVHNAMIHLLNKKHY